MNTELNELEYVVRTIVTDQPWIIYFSAEAEVSGSREEPTIELIELSQVDFIPKFLAASDDYENYMCKFINFDTLYHIFRKDDLDRVRLKVEEAAIEDYFNGLDDYQCDYGRRSYED